MSYYLYILQSEVKETYYTGVSDDPDRRFFFHNNGSKGYTLRYRPWSLVYIHEFASKEKALAAERKIKNWKSKKMIRLLVEGRNAMALSSLSLIKPFVSAPGDSRLCPKWRATPNTLL